MKKVRTVLVGLGTVNIGLLKILTEKNKTIVQVAKFMTEDYDHLTNNLPSVDPE